MKKLLLLFALLPTLFSCTKNAQPLDKPTLEKVPVTFNVSGFTQTVGPITNKIKSTNSVKTNDTQILDTLYSNDKLMYIIYDSNGNQVSRLEERVSDPNKLYRIANNQRTLIDSKTPYGSITDNLVPGTYTIVVAQGTTDASLNVLFEGLTTTMQSNGYPASPLSTAVYYPTSIDGTLGDTFYYKGQLTVSASNTPQSIVLQRIVGQLTFNIQDALPANATLFDYTITTENNYYKISTNTPGGLSSTTGTLHITDPVMADEQGKSGYTHSIYVLNTTTPMTVKISFMDANRNVIATKTVTNVKVNNNESTTLTGKMFDASSASNFTVKINQAWGSNPTVVAIPPANNASVVTIEGIDYPTVTIGNQIWTTVNYKGSLSTAASPLGGSYGNFYKHYDALSIALPAGWRVPSNDDFNKLMSNYSSTKDNLGNYTLNLEQSKALMAISGWDNNVNGSNSSGFNALPAGFYYVSFHAVTDQGDVAQFISSSTSGTSVLGNVQTAVLEITNYDDGTGYTIYTALGLDGFDSGARSVRFVRDK